jgi:hypothetical protein
MNKFTQVLFTTICAASLLTGCAGKDGDPGPVGATGATGATGPAGPTGPAVPVMTGNITGYVSVSDENGQTLPLAKGGVTVTIENSSPLLTATTNSEGRFEFQNVRVGTYNLSFARTGLGTFRRFSIGHVGGDQPTFTGTTGLSLNSATVVTSLNLGAVYSGQYASISMGVSNPTATNNFRTYIFASATSAGATATSGAMIGSPSVSYGASYNTGTISTNITKATLNNAGFASGTQVYLVAYGGPYAFFPSYVDPATGKSVYTSLNATASPIVTFIVP